MRSLLSIFLAIAFLLPAAASAMEADGAPIWADLNDVIKYLPRSMPDAKAIEAALKSDPRFVAGNMTFQFGLHLDYAPVAGANGTTIYRASAMMADATKKLYYRKFQIEIGGLFRQVTNVTLAGDVPLSQMHFTVSTGLIDRMVVLDDVQNDIMMVFPLGVGGYDDNAMGAGRRLLTPQFHNAWIDSATVIDARTNPIYYRGQPFMPITDSDGSKTDIAFHITVLDDQTWEETGGTYLVRGFESHACMRLRLKDLREFYTVVKNSADEKIPVNVDYFVWNRNAQGVRDSAMGIVNQIHPYPLQTNSYMRVTYFPYQYPHYERDDTVEHLVIMDRVAGQPDLRMLSDFTVIDMADLAAFNNLVSAMNRDR